MIRLASMLILFAFFCLAAPCATAQSGAFNANSPEDFFSEFIGMEKSYFGPLPWEGETRFQEALKNNQTSIKLAAYKATLHDPILAEGENIALAAQMIANTVVPAGKIFSQNKSIGPYTQGRGYQAGPTYAGSTLTTTIGGGVCKIASLLYNVATFSNLPIIMRYPHSMTVPYVPPGQDATVYYGVKDFRFLNNTGGPILIWAQKVGDTLYMAFYGRVVPPRVTWHHQVLKQMKYPTYYRINSALAPGTQKQVVEGHDGYLIKSWISIERPDESVLYQYRGTCYYGACPAIVEQGPKS